MSEIVVDGIMATTLVALICFGIWYARDLSRAVEYLRKHPPENTPMTNDKMDAPMMPAEETGLFALPAEEFKARMRDAMRFWVERDPKADITHYGVGGAALHLACEAARMNADTSRMMLTGITISGKPAGDWIVTVQRMTKWRKVRIIAGEWWEKLCDAIWPPRRVPFDEMFAPGTKLTELRITLPGKNKTDHD